MKRAFLFLILLAATGVLTGADPGGKGRPGIGIITGFVYDAREGIPLEYASVILYRLKDSTKVTGYATDKSGFFILKNVPRGKYYLEVDFIGYRKRVISPVSISREKRKVDLGRIELEPSYVMMEPVEVTGEAPPITYKIDKKVVEVSKQPTAVSGTAIDVLENVPSVTVDVEGNVKLRGSENLTLLIDGRPVLLDPSQALQQIPANSIDRIEIITNPSARYDPEGISGIINVILKKGAKRTSGGALTLKGGSFGNYGLDVLYSLNLGRTNLYLSFNLGQYTHLATLTSDRTAGALAVSSEGDFRRKRSPWSFRTGMDLKLGRRDNLSLGGTYRVWRMGGETALWYEEKADTSEEAERYFSVDTFELRIPAYSGFLNYQHLFGGDEHKFTGDLYYSRSDKTIESRNLRFTEEGVTKSGQISDKEGPSYLVSAKLNYSRPFGSGHKLELGYQGKWRGSREIADVSEYDSLLGQFMVQPDFHHDSRYFRSIQALYGLLSLESGAFGAQLGLRGEHTYRKIEVVDRNDSFEINRWDLFPSLHTSYRFSGLGQLYASYSRRIWRPRSWWLEPGVTWTDAYNVREGNPSLKPEYIDSYELGFQVPKGRGFVSAEAFYRVTHDNIERVTRMYEEGVLLHTFVNSGTARSLGAELSLNLTPFRFYNIYWTADLYRYRLEGVEGESPKESFNWSLRLSNEFRFGGARFQANLRYYSPTVTSQGDRGDFLTLDLALKKSFFDRKLNFVLQARDVLGTGDREFTSEGTDFTSHVLFDRKSPFLMAQISYNFNNFRKYKKEIPQEEEGEDYEIY